MRKQFVTVASFNTPEEAELARVKLHVADVDAIVTDTALVGNFWTYGNAVGGVKLQVADQDADRARTALAETDRATSSQQTWRCPKCAEKVDAGFDICWKCGATRDGTEDPSFVPADAAPHADEDTSLRDVPDQPHTDEGDAVTARAFRAAVLGLVASPPLLSIYAACLLLKVAARGYPLSDRASRQFNWAWIFSLFGFSLGLLFVRALIR